jgi:hypothetical protein
MDSLPSRRAEMEAVPFMRWAALICLVATACGSGSGDTNEGRLSTFRSRTYEYEVAHPADWTVIEATRVLDDGEPPATAAGGTDILARHADRRVRDMTLPAMVVGAQRVASTTDIDGWTATVISTVAFMKQCAKPDSTEHAEVAGERAMLLTYQDCPSGSGLFHLWTAVIHRGMGFHIVWFDKHGRETADRAALDKMLSSFSFANGGTPPARP